ncbi:MAG: hypothetical protein QXO16_05285 [Archaeoglobaceae archaeon]
MELVALLIVVAVLALSFLLQIMTKEKEAMVFLAIQLAKNGIRFPCRFIREFYGYTLSERQRICVREIVACELECVDCLANLQPEAKANNIFSA